MRHILLMFPLMFAGCAQNAEPYAPVDNVRYTAIGQDPFWMITIGDDSIVLGTGADPSARPGGVNSHRYPRTLPITQQGVRRWESSNGTAVISVEAFEGPCEGAGGRTYRDRVRVRLSGREMHGCGGPQVGDRANQPPA
jgi:uncharacterized membrane protein